MKAWRAFADGARPEHAMTKHGGPRRFATGLRRALGRQHRGETVDQQLVEAASINGSLLVLGKVVSALTDLPISTNAGESGFAAE